MEIERAREQEEAVDQIVAIGGGVKYDYEKDYFEIGEPPGPVWMRTLLSDDFFRNVTDIAFFDPKVTDDDFKKLEGLKQLKSIQLTGTQVTTFGVQNLQKARPHCIILPP